MAKARKDLLGDPNLAVSHKYYEMTPAEVQQWWYKRVKYLLSTNNRDFYLKEGNVPEYFWQWEHPGFAPVGLHLSMFTQSVELFCNDE